MLVVILKKPRIFVTKKKKKKPRILGEKTHEEFVKVNTKRKRVKSR